MSEPSIDYKALWRQTSSTLDSLSSLKISRIRIKTIAGGPLIVGGFGDVEQAELRTSVFGPNTIIALKKLRPAGDRNQRIRVVASLARELDVWHTLSHPNILRLEGFYLDEPSLGTAWIATRWQKNGNVLTYLKVTAADEILRLKLALDTAQGLAYLHGLSPPVRHGDIKAENTLVTDSGDAVLCDFGLAKIIQDVPSGLTTSGAPVCTLRYAAPELVSGRGLSNTLSSDIWAWACLLLVISTDILPYATKDRDIAIAVAISHMELPADTSSLTIPVYIQSILTKCWQRESSVRPEIAWCQQILWEKSAEGTTQKPSEFRYFTSSTGHEDQFSAVPGSQAAGSTSSPSQPLSDGLLVDRIAMRLADIMSSRLEGYGAVDQNTPLPHSQDNGPGS